jgi:hydrogenase maturation protease
VAARPTPAPIRQPARLPDDERFPAPSAGKVVVIGCGNLLRGDDAAGPIAIRMLWERGVPGDVLLVDGGTAGMDVAFKMDGARRVVLIDAAFTGAAPGTVYRVPGHELAELPPLAGLHSHQFRWDHSLAFAEWLLGERMPADVEVFLIEAESCEPGADLTEPVCTAVRRVCDLLAGEWEQLDDGR